MSLDSENQSPHMSAAPLSVPVDVRLTREQELLSPSPSSPAFSSPQTPGSWSKTMGLGFGAYGLGGILRMPSSPAPRRN